MIGNEGTNTGWAILSENIHVSVQPLGSWHRSCYPTSYESYVCPFSAMYSLRGPVNLASCKQGTACTGLAFYLPAEIAAGRQRFPAANEMQPL